jgi:hypothetical protein
MRNFMTPFRNRVHLVTIILVTTVFATFRLSGSSFEVRSLDGKNSSARSPAVSRSNLQAEMKLQDVLAPENMNFEMNPAKEVQKMTGAQKAASGSARVMPPLVLPQTRANTMRVEDVINSGPLPPQQSPQEQLRVEQQRELNQARSLSDIEKRLGLK